MKATDDNPLIGKTVLDKYQIKREIGRGGMGLVYLAADVRLGREVALKELVISKTLTGKDRDDIISRFNREARTTSTLNHPNIVTIFDVGREHQTHFIAMEYLPGKTLKDYMDEAYPFTFEEILDILIQISSALAHAHAKGVVHRDIKPENIKVLDNHVVKIMDFGIAAIENSKSNLTQDGNILGTIAYISPEQLYSSRQVDNRADIFSFGSMVYELFTGVLPFDGESVGETITKIMTQEPRSPKNMNLSMPERIEKMIMRCLRKDPDERYASIQDVLQELSDFKSSLSVSELLESIHLKKSGRTSPTQRVTGNTPIHILTSSARMRKYRLLYLGEDLVLFRLLSSNCKQRGLPYEVLMEPDLNEAVSKGLMGRASDIVIVDYAPEKGHQIFQFFELLKNNALVVVSSVTAPEMIISTMKRGAVDYIIHTNPAEDAMKILDGIQEYFAKVQNDMIVSRDGSGDNLPDKDMMQKTELSLDDLAIDLFFVKSFGKLGAGPGELSSPRHIHYCQHSSRLMISDTKNARLQIFDANGAFLNQLSHAELTTPCAAVTDSSGNIFALDADSGRVCLFDCDGNFLRSFGKLGAGLQEISSVYGIALFKDETILLSDPEAHMIKLFDRDGRLQDIVTVGFKNHTAYKKPSAISVSQERIYVLDQGDPSVRIWNAKLEQIGIFGERGTGPGQFGVPKGIAADEFGRILVSEALPHRFQVFHPNGTCLMTLGEKGSAPQQFNTVDSIASNQRGKVFVLDKENHRVQIYTRAQIAP